jgi:hypothetical protein
VEGLLVVGGFVAVALIFVASRRLNKGKEGDVTRIAKKERPAPKTPWMGAFEAYGLAYERIKQNYLPLVLIMGLYVVLTIVNGLIQGKGPMDPGYKSFPDLIFLISILGLIRYSIAIADNKRASIRELLRFSFRKYFTILAATLLSLLIILPSMLLIVPIIWTFAWFSFSSYIIVEKNSGPVKSLKESMKLVEHHIGKVWGLVGVSFGIGLIIGATMLIPYLGSLASTLLIAASIWSSCATAILYRWLQKEASGDK